MLKHNLFIKIVIVLLVLAPTAVAFAYSTPSIWPTGYWGQAQNGNPPGLVSCNGNYLVNGSNGTCQNLCDLINTAINIVYFAMSVAIFIIAPILFIVGGIMMMVSGANPEMLSKGRKTLIDTVIGLVIVLCSYLIVNTVITTLKIGGIGGFNSSVCSVAAPTPSTTNSATPAATAPAATNSAGTPAATPAATPSAASAAPATTPTQPPPTSGFGASEGQ